jgi:catechol 2,3-dioxygenase-like lactoylglutathione lyase family enzyme
MIMWDNQSNYGGSIMSYFETLSQVNLYVSDIEKSIKWYVEVLGLRLLQRCGEHTVVLDFGQGNESFNMGKGATSAILSLIQSNEVEATNKGTHPVFRLSQEYKDIIYNELKLKGVQVEENPRNKSHFCFWDIDGNKIELYLPGIYD